jgi:hypothetical protein
MTKNMAMGAEGGSLGAVLGRRWLVTQDPLYCYSRLFIRQTAPPKEEIAAFCDAQNNNVVTPTDFQQWCLVWCV